MELCSFLKGSGDGMRSLPILRCGSHSFFVNYINSVLLCVLILHMLFGLPYYKNCSEKHTVVLENNLALFMHNY